MPGPPPKDAERRQRRVERAGVEITRSGDRIVRIPEPPDGLQERTEEQWEAYWCSDVAQVVERDSDLPAVRRLFQLYDERDRAYHAYRENRLVAGSQGQPVINPLAKMMNRLDTEIRQLEDRLGLNPKARLQLGISMGEAAKSLDELNRSLEPEWESDEEADGDADLKAV